MDKKPLIIAAIVVIAAIGGLLYYKQTQEAPVAVPVPTAAVQSTPVDPYANYQAPAK